MMGNNDYKKAMEKLEYSSDFEERTLSMLNENAAPVEGNKRHSLKRLSLGLTAAVLVLAIGIAAPRLFMSSDMNFKLSKDVAVNYINKAPNIRINSDLISLTEEQMVNQWGDVIASGTVEDIKNIEIKMDSSTNYNAIATFKIDQCIKGNVESGSTIRVLLPCTIDNDGIKVEDTDVISNLTKGSRAILLAKRYDEESIWQEGGSTLYLMEVSEYGLGDGERFAFIEKDGKLIFSDWAWNLSKDATLEEALEYLKTIK